MEFYKELARMFLATEASPLVIGNVSFWIDETGPWAHELTFSIPTSQWNKAAMAENVASLARISPEVMRRVQMLVRCDCCKQMVFPSHRCQYNNAV